jgi:hypothetical protein
MTTQAKRRRIIFGLLVLVSALHYHVHGQIQINSPYTRFGPGNLVEYGMNPRINAMGGLYFGLQANNLINPANPASYAAFDSVSFIFDGGVFGMMSELKTTTLSDRGDYISLSHFMFGFPVTHWWKTSFGLLPFSHVGYDIYSLSDADTIAGLPATEQVYQGSGGYNQLYWGNGFRIGKHLSLGFNLKYIFGSIYRSRGISFPDSVEIKNTYVKGSIRPNDIYGEVGIQYKANLGKDLFMVVGGAFSPQVKINSNATYMVTTYFGDINSVQYSYDTIDFNLNEKGDWTLPIRTGAGVTIGKSGNWLAGADFMWQNWEKYEYYGNSDSLANKWKISIGGEYIPDAASISSYFQRMSYRAGFHVGKAPLEFRGQHLTEIGIGFGLGFPIKKSKSMVNLSAVIGKVGTTQYGLIQENYLKFTLGVNVFENWFFKSKYY